MQAFSFENTKAGQKWPVPQYAGGP